MTTHVKMGDGPSQANAVVVDPAASAAEQEAATAANRYVTPAVQHRHPSAAKVWCCARPGGVLAAGYNVSSTTDTTAGVVVLAFSTNFSSVNWCAIASLTPVDFSPDANADIQVPMVTNFGASSCTIYVCQAGAFASEDPNTWYFAGFGDQ